MPKRADLRPGWDRPLGAWPWWSPCLATLSILIGGNSLRSEALAAPGPAIECCHEISFSTDGGYPDGGAAPVHGYLAWVDLTEADVLVPSLPSSVCSSSTLFPTQSETPEMATARYMGAYGSGKQILSINANFFWWDKNVGIHDLDCLRSIGLAVSTGRVVSPPGETVNLESLDAGGYLPDAVLFRLRSNSSAVEIIENPDAGYVVPSDVISAVSGVLIVKNGMNVSSRAPQSINPLGLEPRTAIGLNAAKTALSVVVIEGAPKGSRTAPKSAGISLPDLANLLIKYGAYDVINLDGGGSTAMTYLGGSRIIQSSPTDMYPNNSGLYQYRPVPVTLMFRADSPPSLLPLEVMGSPVPRGQIISFTANSISTHPGTTFSLRPCSSLCFTGQEITLSPGTWILPSKQAGFCADAGFCAGPVR